MTSQADDSAANDIDDGSSGRLHDAVGSVRDAASSAKTAAADALSSAREKVGGALGSAKEKSGAAYETAREKAGDTYETAREKAGQAYDAARDKATAATRAAGEGLESNPLAAVAGGIALGVLIGALLPRTEREAATLGPLAARLTDGARAAAFAARDAGREKLDELGLNRAAAKESVGKFVDGAINAATSAGNAAADTVRKP